MPATENDWYEEFWAIMAIRVTPAWRRPSTTSRSTVTNIPRPSSRRTTQGMEFHRRVDSSTVLVNAAPGSRHGGVFGRGAEVGISTSKIHAYGPMGIESLTIEKFVCFGDGQIRT
jgi:glutamate-5-semialdehyde dehydrogenase